MANDRFLKEAEGDEEKARELRSQFGREVSAQRGDHRGCDHPSTKADRDRCRRAQRKKSEA